MDWILLFPYSLEYFFWKIQIEGDNGWMWTISNCEYGADSDVLRLEAEIIEQIYT
jgi:hypothetical protein